MNIQKHFFNPKPVYIMAIINWKPLRPTTSLSDWMDDFFNDRMDRMIETRIGTNLPAVNVLDEEDRFELQVAAPGLKKKDFEVNVDNGILSISAERKEEKKEEEDNYTRREFSYTSFQRQFTLPENVKEEDIKAEYEEGILKINIPKQEMELKKKPKQIEIS